MTYEAVHKAIKKGDIQGLRAALDNGLDPNLSNRYGWTILMLAAMEGNTTIGRLLIEAGANLDKRNKGNDTALSLAALCGSRSFAELLLTKGASLDCHPHGNSLDIYLDWLAGFYPERMRNIRKAFDAEREARGRSDRKLSS